MRHFTAWRLVLTLLAALAIVGNGLRVAVSDSVGEAAPHAALVVMAAVALWRTWSRPWRP